MPSTARMDRPMSDVQVHPYRTDTSQNRLVDHFGSSTARPPHHIVGSSEYAIAFAWNSGIVMRWQSSARRCSCAPLTRAAHSAFACVQTTPLGRDVVPEVYWTLIGAPGSGAR